MSATPELKPQQTPNEQVEREPLAEVPFLEVIDEVRKDAQRDPKGYQRETIVPEGGE